MSVAVADLLVRKAFAAGLYLTGAGADPFVRQLELGDRYRYCSVPGLLVALVV
jgi:hypothetical protein